MDGPTPDEPLHDEPFEDEIPLPAHTPWLHHSALYILLGLVFVGIEAASWHWHWPDPAPPFERKQRPQQPRKTLTERFEQLHVESLGHKESLAAAALFLVPMLIGSSLLLAYLILRSCNIRALPRCEFRVATWDAWHVARFLLLGLVLYRLTIAVLGGLQAHWQLAGRPGLETQSMLLALGHNAVLFVGLSLLVLALVAAGEAEPLRALGLREERPASRAAVGLTAILMLLPVIMLARLVTFVYGPLIGIHPEAQDLVHVARTGSPLLFAALAFTGVVIAPIAEEILFRGFLYTTLRRYAPPLGAILLSAVVFSLVHGFAYGFLQLFVIGFLLAYLYERTGSLVASIAAHAANNLYSFLVIWVLYR